MRTRLLLDPASEASGGGGTPAPAAQAPANPPPPAPSQSQSQLQAQAQAPDSEPVAKVPVSALTQYLNDQRELNRLRILMQEEHDQAEQARIAEMARREGAEKALAEQKALFDGKLEEERRKFNDLTGSLHAERKTAVIASNLSGYDFTSPEAAEQARLLIDMDLETAVDADRRIIVRHKGTGRPAPDYIKDVMASPRMAHFLRAQSRGGAGAPAPGAAQSAPGPVPGTVAPASPGEEAFALWWQQQEVARAKGYGPIGLSFASPPAAQNPRGPH